MNSLDIARERLRNQCLAEAAFDKPEDVVRWLGAVQAQEYAFAKWAVAQRTRGVKETEVEQAFTDGTILRTHALRPTWHFVAPADIRWMLQLTAPRIRAIAAFMDRQLGLQDSDFKRGNAVLAKALGGGKHLTRDELRVEFERAGIANPVGPRLAHLMIHAELDALVCSGPRRGKQFTYALLDERVPAVKAASRDEALYELTRRYFTSRGPATLHDFTTWSGLTVADARAGVEMAGSELEHEVVGTQALWFARLSQRAPLASRIAHLLPIYDEYPAAYKDRSAAVGPGFIKPTGPKGDVPFMHALAVDGLVVGHWRCEIKARAATVTLFPYQRLTKDALGVIAVAAKRYSEFLDLPVTLSGTS